MIDSNLIMDKLVEETGKSEKLFFIDVGGNKIWFEKQEEALAFFKSIEKLEPTKIDSISAYSWDHKDILKDTVEFLYKGFADVTLGSKIVPISKNERVAEEKRKEYIARLRKQKKK